MQTTKNTGFLYRVAILVLLIVLSNLNCGLSQAWPDSTSAMLKAEVFMERVLSRHPIALQANLLQRQAEAAERQARGSFDPKLYSDYQQKSFDGKNYYRVSESGIKIPSGLGLEFKGAYLSADGINLNPEEKVPDVGQAVVGLSASLLRGLFIDERRAGLQQARLLAQLNVEERRRLLNNLALEAANAYWNWAAAYAETTILQRALQLAEMRYAAITESFQQGDKPAMDTLEAFIIVQTRRFELREAQVNYRNAALWLSNYLWEEGALPATTNQYRPPLPEEIENDQLLPPLSEFASWLSQHPELKIYQLKTAQLETDRRLAAEQLKPQLDLDYNLLGNGTHFGGGGDTGGLQGLLLQNFKWGARFSMPLLLRKERGKLELVKLKMLETELSIQQKRQELNTKLESYYNEVRNLQQQLLLYTEMTANYQLLLKAENRKFELGESSIFLINSREQKLIETQLKLVKLQNTLPKYRMAVSWAAGRLTPP